MTSRRCFLDSEFSPASPDDAMFHVLPMPLEQTVSYGGGTDRGPAAIIEASFQLEAYDGISYPGEAGIYTAPPIDCDCDIQTALSRLEAATRLTVQDGKIPVILGGEHSLTQASVRGIAGVVNDFGVVQIDAHADLRESYEGSRFSHASVMRRVVEMGVPIFQLGVRNLCREEVEFRTANAIPYVDAREIDRSGIGPDFLPRSFPRDVYVTFDVDGLDASLMPATGTPEPGGLFWWQAISIIESIVESGRRIIGFDVVELAPISGFHASDYLAAKLTYALMGFAARSVGIVA